MGSAAEANAETFLSKWWSGQSTPLNFEMEEWIEQTYVAPEQFWKESVFARQANFLPPSASVYGNSYNFYHDCILRNLKGNKTAFTIVKPNASVESWTYERLHQCVNYQVDAWSSFSPQPKQVIAIVGEPNIYFVISLLTALRCGLTIIYFPTNSPYLGKGKLLEFLSQIKPHYIAAEDASFVVKEIPQLVVNVHGLDEENHSPHSYDYPADCDVMITLSIQKNAVMSFSSFNAQLIYLHALRDGFFALNLLQNPCWSAPLSCPIRTEPISTITTLLCGATRVFVSDDTMRSHPQIIENERIHILGISDALLQLWMRAPGIPFRSLKCIYKNPLGVSYQEWKVFAQLSQIEKIATMDIIYDNAWGGIPIFSRPQTLPNSVFFKPGLGNACLLTHMNGGREPSTSDVGLLNIVSPFNEKQPLQGNLIASKIDFSLMLIGCKLPCRGGITFPIEEVEQCVNDLSFVDICLLHPVMKAGSVFSHNFVLLVFIDPRKTDISSESLKWSIEIEERIAYSLGKGYLPDKIDFFPLVPKMNKLSIDRNWCAAQYQSGMLLQKKNLIQYHMISTLKKMATEGLLGNQLPTKNVSK